MYQSRIEEQGFTLIELAIVLVIIGLIVGGVLAGKSLINAAEVRGQLSQLSKFDSAANTFFGKYGYLPGDIPDPAASSFGFQARGTFFGNSYGQGDGNGLVNGQNSGTPYGNCNANGEAIAFWVDLSAAHLIDNGFNTMLWNGTSTSTPELYLPTAKIGHGNFLYVWSGGSSLRTGVSDRKNYFGLSAVKSMYAFYTTSNSNPGLTVNEAYAMDAKIDDGLPQTGGVIAFFPDGSGWPDWAAGAGGAGTAGTAATAGSVSTCYDNSATSSGTPGVTGAIQHYSLEIGNSIPNCALSFRMRAGD